MRELCAQSGVLLSECWRDVLSFMIDRRAVAEETLVQSMPRAELNEPHARYIVEHVRVHRCFIVATCDKALKQRIRKIPGVPLMYIQARKYTIERMPEAFGAPK